MIWRTKVLTSRTHGVLKVQQVGKMVRRFKDGNEELSAEFKLQMDADKCYTDNVRILTLLAK